MQRDGLSPSRFLFPDYLELNCIFSFTLNFHIQAIDIFCMRLELHLHIAGRDSLWRLGQVDVYDSLGVVIEDEREYYSGLVRFPTGKLHSLG